MSFTKHKTIATLFCLIIIGYAQHANAMMRASNKLARTSLQHHNRSMRQAIRRKPSFSPKHQDDLLKTKSFNQNNTRSNSYNAAFDSEHCRFWERPWRNNAAIGIGSAIVGTPAGLAVGYLTSGGREGDPTFTAVGLSTLMAYPGGPVGMIAGFAASSSRTYANSLSHV